MAKDKKKQKQKWHQVSDSKPDRYFNHSRNGNYNGTGCSSCL